ncbi:GNAT family N-acetyltransferase [Planococcus sp. N028]|uniref:GNAT family N-acetyltransferase n=1 Tax=Planococcus shixiaomingii TaxID=3058393 RepID=A0ABT8N0Q4_9BACL|nr:MULTISPECIES: GNAT family N-acetyltransferase [unclassified Planococcus (in: firmicutes)]MDN7241458.1 GNAT family N-acetyltransferase [Planococcus sp. N028]WKA53712.1 GNAT family N-acetyltransferase [Planococcus sp. N022]
MQKIKVATTPLEKEQAMEVRRTVFIEEQGVPAAIEMDANDATAIHFVGYQFAQPIAAGRIREIEPGIGKVERVCVLPEYRGHRTGVLLMEAMEEHARSIGIFKLKLNSQSYAIPFYEKLGYAITSEEFFEADISHRSMEKNLL